MNGLSSFHPHTTRIFTIGLILLMISGLPVIPVWAFSAKDLHKAFISKSGGRIKTFLPSGNDLRWSNPANWQDGIIPRDTDIILLKSSIQDSWVDLSFSGMIEGLIVESDYQGTLCLQRDLIVSGDIRMDGGNLQQGDYTLSMKNFHQSGGVFMGGSAQLIVTETVKLTGGLLVTPAELLRAGTMNIQSPGIVRLGINGKLELTADGEPLTGDGVLDTLTNRPNSVEYSGKASMDLTDAQPAVGLRIQDSKTDINRSLQPQGFSRAGAALVLPPGGNAIMTSVYDSAHGYAYLGTNEYPGVVLKVDLNTFSYVGAITYKSDEGMLETAVGDPVNGYAYFCAQGYPAKVIKIDINPERPFVGLDAATISDTEVSTRAAVIDPDHGFAYFSSWDYAAPGTIFKVDINPSHPFQLVYALQLETDELFIHTGIIDPENQLAYFSTWKYLEGASIVKIDLVNFSRLSVTPLTTDGYDVQTAVIDPANGFAYYGTDNDPGRIVKLDVNPAHPLVPVNTLVLDPGDSYLSTAVFDSINGLAYFATYTDYPPSKVIKVDVNPAHSFSRLDGIELGEKEYPIDTSFIDQSNGLAYFVSYDYAYLIKVNINPAQPFARLDALTFPEGENRITSGVIDPEKHLAYFGLNSSPGIVVKVDLQTFTRIGALTLEEGDDYLWSAVIDPANQFAYFGTVMESRKIVKVDLSSFTRVDGLQLPVGEQDLLSAVIDPVNGYAYFGTLDSPGIVIKIDVSPSRAFARIGSITLNKGEEYLTSAVLDQANQFAYFGSDSYPGVVTKIDLSTFTRVTSINFSGDESELWCAVLDPLNGYAYFCSDNYHNYPGIIIKVDIDPSRTFTKIAALTLGTDEYDIRSGVIDPQRGFAYFAASSKPGQIIQIDINPDHPFVETNRLTLGYYETQLAGAVIDEQQGFAYFGTGGVPASIIRIYIGDDKITNLFLPVMLMNK